MGKLEADAEIGVEVVRATMKGLGRQMRRAVPGERRSKWSEYVRLASHYAGEDHAAKQAFVERVLAAERPGWVLDVGSNTGTYAMIAAVAGAEVVAIDSDMEAVERLAREAADSGGAGWWLERGFCRCAWTWRSLRRERVGRIGRAFRFLTGLAAGSTW